MIVVVGSNLYTVALTLTLLVVFAGFTRHLLLNDCTFYNEERATKWSDQSDQIKVYKGERE